MTTKPIVIPALGLDSKIAQFSGNIKISYHALVFDVFHACMYTVNVDF